MVGEALASGFSIEAIVIAEDRQENNDLQFESVSSDKIFAASPADFQQISSLQSPEGVLAILPLPDIYPQANSLSELPPGKGLLLDEIQDPGNLGTLIRTADWFGIGQIICRKGTVDCFNPKVLRSSMGSIFRVKIIYVDDWERLVQSAAQRIWLADMEGVSLDQATFGTEDWLLLGNEANGVDEKLKAFPEIRKVHIPGRGGAESLNVGVAGGILMEKMATY